MEYRPIKKEDVETIFLLGKSNFGSSTEYSWDWSQEKISQYLDDKFGWGIVCTDNNKIIGFVLLQKDYSCQKPKVAWLNYVFVAEEHRKKKVGSNLLNLVFSKLKEIGKTDLIADVYLKNKSSLDFFKSNDFEIKEEWAILSRKV